MDNIVEIRNLIKKIDQKTILSIKTINIPDKSIVAIVGPNGSGKTTLMQTIALLESISSGTIKFLGHNIRKLDRSIDNLRLKITYVSHHPYLFKGSVYNNIAYGLKLRSFSKDKIKSRVAQSLKLLSLEDYISRDTQTLSAGEIQRVALARAFVLEPTLLLLDEPFSNIDYAHTHFIETIIKQYNTEKNRTVIISTHSFEQALRMTDIFITLSNGRISTSLPFNHITAKYIENKSEAILLLDNILKIPVPKNTFHNKEFQLFLDPQKLEILKNEINDFLPVAKGKIVALTKTHDAILVSIDVGFLLKVFYTCNQNNQFSLMIGMDVNVHIPINAMKKLF